MYVEAYWNLRKGCFSSRPPGGRVTHASAIVLLNPQFVVQPAGRERVRAEGRKNVHAYVRGELKARFDTDETNTMTIMRAYINKPLTSLPRVRYNPYTDDQWHVDGTPIYASAGLAYLINGKVYLT